ncbi:hypothetical protein [Microbacterium oxydans]|nr:hypothetical protein [Microbacterium oxydans]MCZ4300764.1 hypothetical protein [Microbacterium oxydans]
MIPHTSLRNRLRLALGILRGSVYVDHAQHLGYGQIIRLRTVEDVEVIK